MIALTSLIGGLSDSNIETIKNILTDYPSSSYKSNFNRSVDFNDSNDILSEGLDNYILRIYSEDGLDIEGYYIKLTNNGESILLHADTIGNGEIISDIDLSNRKALRINEDQFKYGGRPIPISKKLSKRLTDSPEILWFDDTLEDRYHILTNDGIILVFNFNRFYLNPRHFAIYDPLFARKSEYSSQSINNPDLFKPFVVIDRNRYSDKDACLLQKLIRTVALEDIHNPEQLCKLTSDYTRILIDAGFCFVKQLDDGSKKAYFQNDWSDCKYAVYNQSTETYSERSGNIEIFNEDLYSVVELSSDEFVDGLSEAKFIVTNRQFLWLQQDSAPIDFVANITYKSEMEMPDDLKSKAVYSDISDKSKISTDVTIYENSTKIGFRQNQIIYLTSRGSDANPDDADGPEYKEEGLTEFYQDNRELIGADAGHSAPYILNPKKDTPEFEYCEEYSLTVKLHCNTHDISEYPYRSVYIIIY